MSHCSCHDKPQHSLLPAAYRILSITRHTPLEWNFRVAVDFPAHWGQFVEVSLPRVGEAPISVSDYGDGWIDLLIRNVGKVTSALFTLKKATTCGYAAAMAMAIRSIRCAINPYWLSQAARASRR